ncbi:MAG: VWA domain-containing protein [Flavobacteriales bacterium]|nr:VWA domain-containing protein [Flavobacteriales bacterium]
MAFGLVAILGACSTNHYKENMEIYTQEEAMEMGEASEAESIASESYAWESEQPTGESYAHTTENRFNDAAASPLSTFSIDVDHASYTNVRRFLMAGSLPPAGAVRIEEMINYFPYDYEGPKDDQPFAVHTAYGDCPWNPSHKLLQIGLQGKKLSTEHLPASNLVFLIDVSGSMSDANKLPLLKRAFKQLVNNLGSRDRVAMVVYAGAAGLVLPSTSCDNKEAIMDALDKLEAGGSTAGGAGIELAYQVASEHLVADGNNRVILATDGDFNVGVSSEDGLVRLIEKKREQGVFLTICGFGIGNYQDSDMEAMSNAGNGNYFYIDSYQEAHKVFSKEMQATLFTIAKDVKIQVEFNPKEVQQYRLIGYENRMLQKEDFNDDKKDAGELGAGHAVTALYEIVPVGATPEKGNVDPLKYQKTQATRGNDGELATVKLRYKLPDGSESKLLTQVVRAEAPSAGMAAELQFASAVSAFGMVLRKSEYAGNTGFSDVLEWAKKGVGSDPDGFRLDFIELVELAEGL